MAGGGATVMLVLGALALLLGGILVISGPDLIGNGYEEESFSDERHLTAAGQQIRLVGWVVASVGAILVLIGTGVRVSGKAH